MGRARSVVLLLIGVIFRPTKRGQPVLPVKRLWFVLLGLVFSLKAGLVAAQQVEVLWLGHAATRITSVAGKVIVIDPFLKANPKTPAAYRDLNALGKVDLILVTHGHPDHLGDLPELARLTGAPVVANYELGRNLIALELLKNERVIGMNKGGSIEPLGRGITIHMVPAEHSSSIDLVGMGLQRPDAKGFRYLDVGAPVGYFIELENGFKIYHSGDTAVFGDMALIGSMLKPDLALVCIGGHFTMGPEGAAYAVRELLKPKLVLPIHYGTFPVLNRTPAEFRRMLGDAPVEMLEAEPGQALRF